MYCITLYIINRLYDLYVVKHGVLGLASDVVLHLHLNVASSTTDVSAGRVDEALS